MRPAASSNTAVNNSHAWGLEGAHAPPQLSFVLLQSELPGNSGEDTFSSCEPLTFLWEAAPPRMWGGLRLNTAPPSSKTSVIGPAEAFQKMIITFSSQDSQEKGGQAGGGGGGGLDEGPRTQLEVYI